MVIENSNINFLKEKIKLCNRLRLDTNQSGHRDFSSSLCFCYSLSEPSATSGQSIPFLSYSFGCIHGSSLPFLCISKLGLPAFLESVVSQAEVERKGEGGVERILLKLL